MCLFHLTTAVLNPAKNGSADSRLLWIKQEWKKGLDVWGRAYKGLGRRRKFYLVGGEKEVGVTIVKVFKLELVL